MKVGIYNRWLQTLGGGERYMCALAACLATRHDVEILTHRPVSPAEIAARLGLDLGAARISLLPFDPDYAGVVARTAGYDLFVNASHHDIFPSLARASVQQVSFPGRLADRGGGALPLAFRAARAVKLPLARWLLGDSARIRLVSGFAEPRRTGGDHHRAVSGAGTVAVPRPGRGGLRLRLRARPGSASGAALSLGAVGRPRAAELELPVGGFANHEVAIGRGDLPEGDAEVLVELTAGDGAARLEPADVEIAWVKLAQPAWREALAQRLLGGDLWYVQNWGSPPRQTVDPLASYGRIWANSRYTRRWIEAYWGRSAEVLYPPCDPVCDGLPTDKRNVILSVGRFFAGSHNKKHIPMIRAFKALCDAGFAGWEYHLAGGYDAGDHVEYMAAVEAEAAGYPVFVHKNASLAELRSLYRVARVFWHATGLGEDEAANPEAAEHFGITTVEAMSAGCVPLVIARAGQLEIVRSGADGFLWHTVEELQRRTRQVAGDEALRRRLAAGARERSRAFDRQAFERRLWQLVDGLDSVDGAAPR